MPRNRPTLKTIAELTGLAVATVSRALNDAPDISAATKVQVRKVASKIGYLPDRAGVRLRTGKTNVISLIMDQDDRIPNFARRIIVGISKVLADTNYHLVVTPQFRDESVCTPINYILASMSADGVIFTHTRPLDERIKLLQEHNFPFTTHGRSELNTPHSYHDFDNRAFAYQAALRLVSKGRRNLALLAPPRQFTYHGHTLHGFNQALYETGAQGKVLTEVDLDTPVTELRDFVKTLTTKGPLPDGIVSGSELCTIALIDGLKQVGLDPGTDYDMVSKQTANILDVVSPGIDSLYEDLIFAGEKLAEHLLAQISGTDIEKTRSLSQPKPLWRSPSK